MTNNPIYSKIVGRDTEPTPVSEALTDWFGVWLSQHEPTTRPATLRDVLTKVLPRRTWVPFVVGDGTYLQYSEENKQIHRQLRFTIVSTPERPSNPSQFPEEAPVGNVEDIVRLAFGRDVQTVFVVGSPLFDDPGAFLQVASWDAKKNRLNFYQRERGSPSDDEPRAPSEDIPAEPRKIRNWFYLGSSFDAFAPDTKGKGPFCGHVNGTLVMKELRTPWIHWHSSRYAINQTFGPDDKLLREELLQPSGSPGKLTYLALGDRFETIVTRGINQWYLSRLQNDLGPSRTPNKTAVNIISWMRHVLSNTTFNIAGASVNTDAVIANGANMNVPHGFFYNNRVIEDMLPPDTNIPPPAQVMSALYNSSRVKLGLKTIYSWKDMEPGTNKGIAFDHEGQTPWCVIVPSQEDAHGINRIIASRLLSTHEVLSFLMIDFPNPVYSRRREELLKYVPDTCTYKDGQYDLGDILQAKISASPAAKDPESPEYEYLQNISLSDTDFANRIVAYMTKVAEHIQTAVGVEDYLLLAESRRRIFRPFPSSTTANTNPLSEFSKTLPYATLIPEDWKLVKMTEEGQVRVMGEKGQRYAEKKIAQKFMQTPKRCHTVDAEGGCPYMADGWAMKED